MHKDVQPEEKRATGITCWYHTGKHKTLTEDLSEGRSIISETHRLRSTWREKMSPTLFAALLTPLERASHSYPFGKRKSLSC
jgi:hypothetical protein